MRQRAILIFLPCLISAAMPLVVASCSSDATDSADAGPEQGAAGTGLATGLPCDVQAVIENRCIACHDGTMSGLPKLLDYATLVAPSTKDPSKSRAVVAVELMRGGAMPPRPAEPPADDEIAAFEDWVNNGTYREPTACTTPPPRTPSPGAAADGGTSSGGSSGDASAPGVCTSGQRWTQGNTGSPLMHPGNACNACHQVSGGPNLRFAGTIYPTSHEANDCNGVAPPPQLSVIVTDSRGATFTMAANAAGNFLLQSQGGQPPHAPFRARITNGTKERAMQGSVTSGDCNSCHTTAGLNGAPGRILAP